ncbi:hypothetical protein HY251_09935 [bacterium]|nr:hypothetical protein [bacterium]
MRLSASRLAPLATAMLATTLAGCLGSNRKPRPELDAEAPKESRGSTPLFVYREIGVPASPTNIVKLVIEKNGLAELEHGGLSKSDRLGEDEKGSLTSLAGQVGWDSVPTEYVAKTPRPDPKATTYEITYGGTDPSHTVTTHDGVDSEDQAFSKLRKKL